MKLKRKIFINRNNGQASLTLPRKVLDKLKLDFKLKKFPKEISLEILTPK